MAGKVVFRGSVQIHALFRDVDGNLKTWDHEVPFSQFEDLQREYSAEAEARIIPAVTGMELEVTAPDMVRLKAGLVGQYVITDQSMLELVEDAYSNVREVTPQVEELLLPTVLDDRVLTVKLDAQENTEGQRILDTAFLTAQPMVHRDDGGVELEQSGAWQLLLLDREGRLQGQVLTGDEDVTLDADGRSRITAFTVPTGAPHADLMGSQVNTRSDVRLDTWTTSEAGIPMVTGLELGEAVKPDPERPSMILRRSGTARLWDLAKSSGSTVAAIREVNRMEGEPEAGRMLLIPIVT